MIIFRTFAWPTRFPAAKRNGTGSIQTLYKFLISEITDNGKNWVDPMCGRSKLCELRNDFRTARTSATYHLDALQFLKGLASNKYSGALYDPPYNDRQGVKYSKKFISRSNLKYYSDIKKEIVRICRPGGKIISLGWNSNKFPGPVRIIKIGLFAHGSDRNDTIVCVQIKSPQLKLNF